MLIDIPEEALSSAIVTALQKELDFFKTEYQTVVKNNKVNLVIHSNGVEEELSYLSEMITACEKVISWYQISGA